MMFGLLFSLKAFANKLDPTRNGEDHPGECKFHAFKTNNYKLHFMEHPTGIRLVLTTEAGAPDLRELMKFIYSTCYVDCVVKNHLYKMGEPFKSDGFTAMLNKAIQQHS
eukprot:CAMPEP_0114252270 /NCGR_PEP_ID=MMETSP0058-20121206/15744_1 /TAXON_ID=36894 /ORGANISM="Pyramimonas parkeae, CCMP726" /LENGTH=108 /DNA_ID=CAMNT_0001366187 /DNA_START=349 /DNA_END=675 /DNA_ORIENTATION=+